MAVVMRNITTATRPRELDLAHCKPLVLIPFNRTFRFPPIERNLYPKHVIAAHEVMLSEAQHTILSISCIEKYSFTLMEIGYEYRIRRRKHLF